MSIQSFFERWLDSLKKPLGKVATQNIDSKYFISILDYTYKKFVKEGYVDSDAELNKVFFQIDLRNIIDEAFKEYKSNFGDLSSDSQKEMYDIMIDSRDSEFEKEEGILDNPESRSKLRNLNLSEPFDLIDTRPPESRGVKL